MQQISEEKNKAVKAQDYEYSAMLRDQEKKLMEQVFPVLQRAILGSNDHFYKADENVIAYLSGSVVSDLIKKKLRPFG
ncbi:hypothetical protein RCC89_07635 [Cytophagaceae bacterium ABcell3]|nr:hypothetical protein RCC89_07635 [Cytophagaceae bacterium ABcell3]